MTVDLRMDEPSAELGLVNVEPLTQRLQALLALEFDALKARDLPRFEELQAEKNSVLEQLSALAQWATAQSPIPPAWQDQQEALRACREAHLRNIQLMQRQLQAVRGALQALQGEEAAAVDLYDRLGRMSRPQGNWSQHVA
jgi:flagellar biosynthesis/type III secretory pathway chaperone